MSDIVERLRFDAARCEATFSKGIATNIEEAVAEIEKLREALEQALDDMGPDDRFGLCVCAETKDMMRAALGHQQTQAKE